jgi:hypothetical protein
VRETLDGTGTPVQKLAAMVKLLAEESSALAPKATRGSEPRTVGDCRADPYNPFAPSSVPQIACPHLTTHCIPSPEIDLLYREIACSIAIDWGISPANVNSRCFKRAQAAACMIADPANSAYFDTAMFELSTYNNWDLSFEATMYRCVKITYSYTAGRTATQVTPALVCGPEVASRVLGG